MQAMDTIRAVVKQSRNRRFEEAEYHVGELQKNVADQRNTLSSLVATEKDSLSELEKEVKEQRNSISLLQREVTDLRKAHDTLSTLAQDVAQLKEWRLSEERQELITRLSKEEAALSEGTVRVEHADVEIPEPSDKSDKVLTTKPQPKDVALPSDRDTLEETSAHELSRRVMLLEARQHCDHPVAESIWESIIVLNLRATGIAGSAFLMIGLAFNVLLQVTFLYVVYFSFLESKLPDVQDAWEWRELQGHHSSNMIRSTQLSLVRAVCESSPLLLSSATQQSDYEAIVEYQTTKNVGVPLGGLLCTMVLCTWVMYIGEEFHSISSFSNAILHLPRGKSTQLILSGDEVTFASCSMGRIVFVMLVLVVRVGVAGTLLSFGSIWLARTVDLQELVLNACALAMVLDMDELIFASVVTRTVKVLVREIKPLKRSMGMRFVSFGSPEVSLAMNEIAVLVGAASFTAFIIFAYVLPSMQQMEDLEAAYCGGFKDFVFEQSSLDVIAVTGSRDPSSGSDETEFAQNAIYDLVVGASSRDDLYKFNKTLFLAAWDDFTTVQLSDIGTLVDVFTSQVLGTSCEDYDFAAPGAVPSFREVVKSLFGDTVDSCEDLVAYCPGDSRLLRMICPETCGCAHPFSGLFKRGRNQGCPAECLASSTFTSQLASIPCVDYSLSNLTQMPGWEAFLTQWVETWVTSQPRQAEQLRQASSAMLTYGCFALGLLPARVQSMFCQPTSEYGSLNAYCPMSCNCITSASEDCPAQCSTIPLDSNRSGM